MKPTKRTRQLPFTVFLLISLTLAVSTTLIPQAIAQETYEVKIQDFAFTPEDLTIRPGDTVEWNNTDPVVRTLWFVNQTDNSTYLLSEPIGPDTTWTHTFNEIVNLKYYDLDRLWMTGFLNVGIHDIAVINLTVSTPRIVSQPVFINATVENQGDYTETFDVSAYYTIIGDPLIGTQPVTDLLPGENKTLTFEWMPSLISRYEILANTTEIHTDFDPNDNTRIITIEVSGSESQANQYVNSLHAIAFLCTLFAAAMIGPEFRKNKKTTQLQNLHDSRIHISSTNKANSWQEWITRQKIK